MLLKDNFTGLQHLGLPVTDIERSREFYKQLGFEEIMTAELDFGGPIRVAMMKRADAVMELYQMPEEQLVEIRTREDGPLDHIAFSVADVDAAFEELKSAGMEMNEEAPILLDTFWAQGCKFFTIRGPDGERLEFNQIL